MRQALYTITTLGLCSLLLTTGCKKEDETPPANSAMNQPQGYQQQPAGYQQQPAGYQQQPGAYPQQQQQPGAYPQQQQPAAYPQQTAPAGAAPTAAAGASPAPNALATPCKSDAECIGARCNLQAQKCQFPCGSNNDCQTGWACMMGACAPSMNTQPAPK